MPPVTPVQLVKYAGASDDYNPIHYNADAAAAAGLGGIIAHGMLTMGFIARAVTDWAGPRAMVSQIDARFTSPVRPGDVVEVVGAVTGRSGNEAHCELTASVGGKTVAQGAATVRFAA
jgi:acyl dehydratase